ncbi:MAG TPA: crossover junction endodeoxyribonuclease RuvC [Firmicutes bacterium]|nr:crossover junction endodeoxyribonuclease RuvC [Bacillota bacterium]
MLWENAPVPESVRILGIDPGLNKCGYAVIDYNGRSPKPVEYGLIRTKPKTPIAGRLHEIIVELGRIIDEFKPDECAVERVYFHRNVSTAIDVAMVMGAAIVLACEKGLVARQYAPLQVKRAIVGTGRADKNQVQRMVMALYRLESMPKPPDVADALAVALTHAHLRNSPENAAVG